MPERSTETDASTLNPPDVVDRVLRWPFWWGLIVLGIICFVMIWPISQIAFSLICIFWAAPLACVIAVLLPVTLWIAGRNALRAHWRTAFSALVFPLALVLSFPAGQMTMLLSNEVHFLLHRSYYIAEAQKQSKGRHPGAAVFDWGGNPMIGVERFLEYDESDEIAKPVSKRSARARSNARDHGFTGSENYWIVQTVWPHFYVVDY